MGGVLDRPDKIKNNYTFPLISIVPQELVTWSDGPRSTKFFLDRCEALAIEATLFPLHPCARRPL